jgi:DNA-binding FadR family transcriptional regulator
MAGCALVKWSDQEGANRSVTFGREAKGSTSLPLEVLAPRRLYRLIADQLRQLIDGGEYPVGSRLPTERELAEKLGVSRPTVREALIDLEVEGRLRIKVGSGIHVIEPRHAALVPVPDPIAGPFEVIGARAFIESAVAEEAARVAEAEDIARLNVALAKAEAMRPSPEAWIALDREFHIGLAAALGNAVLVRCVGDLFDQRVHPYFQRLAQHMENPATWRAAHAEHKVVRDAIADRDPQAARTAMSDHLARSHERFARDFGEAPVDQADRQPGSRPGSRHAERGGSARTTPPNVARARPSRAGRGLRTKVE